MSSPYDSEYYRSSNYADYLERADRYKKTASEISSLLRSLSLINDDSNIIDYGCAVGFLIDGLKAAGHKNVFGFEVSEWAIEQAEQRGHVVYKNLSDIWERFAFRHQSLDLMIALDVFEHMTDSEIVKALYHSNANVLLVRIPSSTDGGKTFSLEISRQDPTHINCKTKEQWIEFFQKLGFKTFLRLNLYTVYDTPGVSCLLML